MSRIGSILGVLVFPNMVKAWGTNSAMWLFCAVGFAGLVICIALAPETLNRTLEELNPESPEGATSRA